VKILLVHEYYRTLGGEDSMFAAERELLRRAGHEVVSHELHHDAISASPSARAMAALSAVWSVPSYRAMRRLLRRVRPDVVHFHNTFPLVSPSAYRAAQLERVPVVQTLHNYRLICPGGLLQRASRPCEDCVGRNLGPALRHACYRESRAATAVTVGMLLFNRARGSYRHDVDRYIVLTEFARALFVRGGLPADRLVVRPNGLPDDPGPGTGDGAFALFAGRLSREKGAACLLEAWHRVPGLPLVIAGDGPLRADLEARAQALGDRVRFVGRQPRARILELMQSASLVVLPSECYEGLPVTFIEALACGTPIAASRLGALGELMIDGVHGVHFPPADPTGMAAAIARLLANPSDVTAIRARNRALFETRYSPAEALRSLEAIYRSVIGNSAQGRSRSAASPHASAVASGPSISPEQRNEDRPRNEVAPPQPARLAD